MPSMKTEINHNLLTQKIESSKSIEYSNQIVKFICRVIEYLRNNKQEKGARFAQRYFLHKILKLLDGKGVMR